MNSMGRKKIFLNLALVLIFSISNIAFSQSKENIIFRKKTEKQKSVRTTKSMQKVEVDSTFFIKNKDSLLFLNEFKYFNDKKLFDNYFISVFSKKNATIQQFIVPIVIYLDTKIPKNITLEYKTFVNNIPKIKNLDITFTDKKEEANYLLTVADKDFYGISKKSLNNFDDQDHDKLTFLKMSSTNINDYNNKTYAYILKISPSILKEKQTIHKLKKAFFQSLGNFNILSYGAPEGSALDFNTTEINNLITEDIQLLKMHYHHIYNFKVNANNFYKLYFKFIQNKN